MKTEVNTQLGEYTVKKEQMQLLDRSIVQMQHFTEIFVELETVYSDPNVAAFRMASKTFGYL